MPIRIVLVLVLAARLSADNLLWTYRYDGAGHSYDGAKGLVCGLDSNLYVTGYVTGPDLSGDFAVISLKATGQFRWLYAKDGPGNSFDDANAVAVGPDGNIYAAGSLSRSFTNPDFAVASVTPAGAERWTYTYNGPGNSYDVAYDIAIDRNGNIYAAGMSLGSGSDRDIFVVSLTSAGSFRWSYRYNGPGNSMDFGNAVCVGPDGNVYVVGRSRDAGYYYDFTVVSLTPAGAERWVYLLNGTHDFDDEALAVCCGPDSSVYAAGYTCNDGTDRDFTILSLRPDSTERWEYVYDAPGYSDDAATSIVCGAGNNIYAGGRNYGTNSDIAIAGLTGAGDLRWRYTWNGPANATDWGYSVCQDAAGNLYCAGFSTGPGRSWEDFCLVSCDDSGHHRGAYIYPNARDSSDDAAYEAVCGPDGNIYAAGECRGWPWSDLFVIGYSPAVGIAAPNPPPTGSARTAIFLRDRIRLDLGDFAPGPITVLVQDILGRRVLSAALAEAGERTEINSPALRDLAPGVYSLVVTAAGAAPAAFRLVKLP